MLSKDELKDLIDHVAGPGEVLGGRALGQREAAERAVGLEVTRKYWGLVHLGDAFQQFHADTLAAVANRQSNSSTESNLPVLVRWHILCAHRFRASHHLWLRGYTSEVMTLARGLWETALTMAALHHGVVSLGDLFGSEPGASRRDRRNRSMETDRRIQREMLWRDGALSEDAREAVNVFLSMANAATHKQKVPLLLDLGQPTPLLPAFDHERIEASGNVLFVSLWCVAATIEYLSPLLPDVGDPWHHRHRKLFTVLEEAVGQVSNGINPHFREIVDRVFRRGSNTA